MNRTEAEHAHTAYFTTAYDLSLAPVCLAITNAVCGCDYPATSWTTRQEAEEMLALLRLGSESRLLDLGAGAGWPGLFLARQSGCRATLLDLPENGLRIARARAKVEGISRRVRIVVGDAADQRFRDAAFDAISHSDLLCCLVAKQKVLAECRRVIKDSGRMVFSVIGIAPGLPAAVRREAVAFGPDFMDADQGYPEMLAATGWRVTERRDITSGYESACVRMVEAERARADDLRALVGAAEAEQRLGRLRGKLAMIRRRVTYRELFAAVPG